MYALHCNYNRSIELQVSLFGQQLMEKIIVR